LLLELNDLEDDLEQFQKWCKYHILNIFKKKQNLD
jgi:hypothetical protein